MDEPPVPEDAQGQFAAYPRPGLTSHGSADKLWALWQGYSGLSLVFMGNVVLVVGAQFLPLPATEISSLQVFLLAAPIIGLVVGFASYPSNKKIGIGLSWSPSSAIVASMLMGLNSAFCCGIIGYVVMQHLATKEMVRYGMKPFLVGGVRKSDVMAVMDDLRVRDGGPGGFG